MYSEHERNVKKVLFCMFVVSVLASYSVGLTHGQIVPPTPTILGHLATWFTMVFGLMYLLINYWQDDMFEVFSWLIAGALPWGSALNAILYLIGIWFLRSS